MPRKHEIVIGVALYPPDRAGSKHGIVATMSLASRRRLKSMLGSYRKNLQIRSGGYGRTEKCKPAHDHPLRQSTTDTAKSQAQKTRQPAGSFVPEC
jgi:hypothetical protein